MKLNYQKRPALSQSKGFTLLEVLLVVAIIAILAGIVILALNPARQLSASRDSQRWVDVNTILNGVYQYAVDNNGVIPTSITAVVKEICNTGVAAGTCTSENLADLSALTTNETYLVAIPKDPSTATTNSSKYTIKRTTGNRVTVAAPSGELDTGIAVTR